MYSVLYYLLYGGRTILKLLAANEGNALGRNNNGCTALCKTCKWMSLSGYMKYDYAELVSM